MELLKVISKRMQIKAFETRLNMLNNTQKRS